MKDTDNENAGSLRKREADSAAEYSQSEQDRPIETRRVAPWPNGRPQPPRFDVWMALDLVAQRWHWLVLGSFLTAGLLFLTAWWVFKPKFTASGQLLRYEALGKTEYLKATPISADTFAGLMKTPDLLRKVGSQVFPPLAPEILSRSIKIDPQPDSDMVNVLFMARDPRQAVELLNLYLTNVVEYTRDLEAQQMAVLANDYLKREVEQMDQDLKQVQDSFLKSPGGSQFAGQLAQVGSQFSALSTNLAGSGRLSMVGFAQKAEALRKAQGELYELLLKYTEIHPSVQAKQAQIHDLEAGLANTPASTNLDAALAAVGPLSGRGEGFSPELDIIHIKLRALEDSRQELLKRQREAELYAANPPGTVRVLAPATPKSVKTNMRGLKLSVATIFGACLGLAASIALVLLVEFADNRLKTEDDVKRVTGLPVLTALGNLHEMTPQARAHWAFRTWTMLQGRLSPSANHGLVCGVTSSAPGEGRSTWISLLAEAASLTGFRVLTIATRPSPSHVESTDGYPEEPSEDEEMNGSNYQLSSLTTSVLAAPAQVTEQLTGPNSQPVVHIPLPGWVWNLERRKQWREALNHWSGIDNLVILVELPPAGVPEAVLLGANLPNMLWLANSGTAHAGATRAQLETLRDARCRLAGAVLNHEPGFSVKKQFPRWLSCLTLFAALSVGSARAQETNAPPAPVSRDVFGAGVRPSSGAAAREAAFSGAQKREDGAAPEDGRTPALNGYAAAASPAVAAPDSGAETQAPRSFSIVNPSQRAAWQQHLTLGPGDVLTFNLYGEPELVRTEVAVGPDGRVSYLEAQDIMAAGRTIDELRADMDQQLGKFRRAPRTIVTPVAFKSKKYYMLGKVTTKGVFTLDRPLTVLEALARAHGLESALVDRNVQDLTDFQRSFLARGGKRLPLNFERLFQQGDLSQNVAVEPGDYIYFAPGDLNEVYVVGEVRLPGPVSYTPDMTIISAITARGGYTDRAYKTRVLVVRGSLSHPEAIAVDTHAILDARGLDFKLRPKDIIYVNSRPFILVEEAADLAATAFIQSVIASWTGVSVIKPF